jgi:hypothetical protein
MRKDITADAKYEITASSYRRAAEVNVEEL